MRHNEPIRYSILDPTGNITALVESPVETGRQPAVAAALMERHPEVEQVGFLKPVSSPDDPVQGTLRMAGGEFCGNASMCAAALYLLRRQQAEGIPLAPSEVSVRLRVSGAAQPVEVRLQRESEDSFQAGVRMPAALGITETAFTFEQLTGLLPVVRMEGISHIIIEPDSPFRGLQNDRAAAEGAVRAWCGTLSADGLGLMFLDAARSRLTPLVYIPGSGTVFWENSCASGSSAAGMYLAARTGVPVDLTLAEPGGSLRVVSDPAGGETWLYGRVRLLLHDSFVP